MILAKRLLVVYCVLQLVAPLRAQDSIVLWHDDSENKLHRWSNDLVCHTEKTIGLVTEVNFLPRFALGAGFAYGSFELGEGFTGGHGITIGVDYIPNQKILAPYGEVWNSGNAYLFGFFYGVRTLWYIEETSTHFSFRPELGYGFGKYNLYYGRNIFFNKEFTDIPRNTLTLSVYFSVFPFW